MTIGGFIGELIFIVLFVCLIFGLGVLVGIIDFVFKILYLLYKKIFRT